VGCVIALPSLVMLVNITINEIVDNKFDERVTTDGKWIDFPGT
jgi:hypothetical protein